MQKLSLQNILELDNLPGLPARVDFLLGQYLREIGLRPSVMFASALPMEENELGDFRFVISEKTLYTWTGTEWVPLSGGISALSAEQGSFVDGINPSVRNQNTTTVAAGYACCAVSSNAWDHAKADGTFLEANASAVYTGTASSLFTSGAVINEAPFTSDGGKPEVNSICFLAVGAADGGTGAGKFSAKPPFRAGEWVVRCGTVVDNSFYEMRKVCKIIFYPVPPIQL